MMLDAHPEIAVPPETGFIPEVLKNAAGGELSREALLSLITGFETWPDFHVSPEALKEELQRIDRFTAAEGVRAFYRVYARRFGKSRWGDKTPNYGMLLEAIGRFLPEARFLHIIRDGRDVAASIRDLWFAPSRDFGELGKDWDTRVGTIRAQGREYPFYLEIRFEALVTDTERVLQEICAFLGIRFHAHMTSYYRFSPLRLEEHEARYRADGSLLISRKDRLAMQRLTTHPPVASRIGAWKTVMSEEDQQRFLQAAPLLTELGYA
jgi:hypothetical protein